MTLRLMFPENSNGGRMVVLHALGDCVIRTGMASITPRADIGFALAVRLIAERGRRIPRRSLVAELWPGATPEGAAHTLSEALHKLRRKGVPIARDEGPCVWVPREAVALDVDTLASAPPRELVDRDLTILPGYEPDAASAFHDWLDDWRSKIRDRLVSELIHASERARIAGDARTVVGLAEQIMRLDAENETAIAVTTEALNALRQSREAHQQTDSNPSQGRRDVVNGEIWRRAVYTVPRGTAGTPGADEIRLGEKPGPIYEAIQIGFKRPQPTPLVGRADELAACSARLGAARAGRGGIIYLTGAAGIGKSRLAKELVAGAQVSGFAVKYHECQPSQATQPLSSLAECVAQIRLVPGAAGASPAFAQFLDRLANLTPTDSSQEMPTDSQAGGYQTRNAILDLFDAVADEQPLLLVVDNAQWLDTQSSDFVLESAKWMASRRILIVLVARAGRVLPDWQHSDRLTHVRLGPLGPLAARDQANAYLAAHCRTLPEPVLTRCTEAAAGNPFVLEELISHSVTAGEHFAVPESLIAFVEGQLEQLSEQSLRVLQVCAILGQNATPARVEEVLGYPPQKMLEALETLGSEGMLETDESAVGHEARLRCRDEVLERAAVGKLSTPTSKWLHLRAARLLQTELGDSSPSPLRWACAAHWYEAGNPANAAAVSLACIRHLTPVRHPTAAADACQEALPFCTTSESKREVLTVLARSLYLTRSWGELVRVLKAVRECEGELSVDLRLLELDVEWHTARDWGATLVRAESLVAECTAAESKLRAGMIAMKLATSLGQVETMHRVHAVLEDISAGSRHFSHEVLMSRIIYHAVCGSASTCVKMALDLLGAIRDEAPDLGRIPTQVNCASALFRAGATESADQAFESAFALASELKAPIVAAEVCTKAAATYLDVNDVDAAETWVQRHRAIIRPAGVEPYPHVLRLHLARIELAKGNVNSADHLLWNDGSPVWTDPVAVFRAAALATKIRIDVEQQRSDAEVTDRVKHLEQLHHRLKHMGSQDFEALSLYLGLLATSGPEDATSMLLRYVGHERRDPLPVSDEILDVLKDLV